MPIASLPRHHVARPRLVTTLEGAPIVAVIAGGGYGKTTLAIEAGRAQGIATALTRLVPGGGLQAGLAQAFRASGLSDAALALAGGHGVERLVATLQESADPVQIVLDEVEHLAGLDLPLVGRLADALPEGHRLVLTGRALPTAIARCVTGPVVGQAELAFTTEDAAALLDRVGLTTAWAARLRALADGWPIAVALAAERLAGSADLEAEFERMETTPSLARGILAAPLEALEPGIRAAVGQLAHLPRLTVAAARAVACRDDVLEVAAAAGIPFRLASDGRVELPDPVRDAIAAPAGLTADAATRAASAYVAEDMSAEAIRVLVSVGDADGAATAAAGMSAREVSTFDVRDLAALLGSIPAAALDAHPRARMHLARACEASADRELRSQILERTAARSEHDDALAREVDAEVARDLVRDGKVDEAAAVAEQLLATAGPEELQTRVRALHVLGRTRASSGDPAGLAAAEPLLTEAAELYGRLGFATAKAHALVALAYDVQTLGGRFEEAVETLERALAALPRRSRLRAVALTFQAEALIDLGRLVDAEARLTEAGRLGTLFGDSRTLGYTAWLRARAAASGGDAMRVRAQLAEAERHRGAWFDHHTGAEFLAEAAQLLDQVGDPSGAAAFLTRAREREAEAPRHVQLAAAAIDARGGDPAAARPALAAIAAREDLELRERWRVALLQAWTARRVGDVAAERTHTRHAVELAESMGTPDIIVRREPAIAAALLPGAAPVSISVLGGFAVQRAGEPVALPPGLPTAIVKLLALSGGRRTAEEAIELLWPEADPASGRKRLRNVLNRLRDTTGDLVVREGEVLALADGTEVDAELFERRARSAASEGSDGMRAALAFYRGEVLPGDRYADWAAEPRERVRTTALGLLDLLAAQAESEGEIDEALRLLARAIELDRLDESRYTRSARLLLLQGKRGRALDVLRAAAGALRELGLEPSAEHRALVRSTRV